MELLMYNKNIPIIKISYNEEKDFISDAKVIIEDLRLLPYQIKTNSITGLKKSLTKWFNTRIIINRRHLEKIVDYLQIYRKIDKILYTKCLSLNDCFWVDISTTKLTWEDINLYDNKFSYEIAQLSFLGISETNSEILHSTPELTTGGIVPKFWSREEGDIYLNKSEADSSDVISEVLVSKIAKILGINCLDYNYEMHNNSINISKCKLFTSKDIGFLPISTILEHSDEYLEDNIEHLYGYSQFQDLCILDFICGNVDRHQNNWGMLIDNNNRDNIIAPAPIFDNGFALFSYESNKHDFLKSMKKFYKSPLFTSFKISYLSRIDKKYLKTKVNLLLELQNIINQSSTFDFIYKDFKNHTWRIELIKQFLSNQINTLLNYVNEQKLDTVEF